MGSIPSWSPSMPSLLLSSLIALAQGMALLFAGDLASRFAVSTHPLVEEVEAELGRAIGEAVEAQHIAAHDPALLTEVAMGIFISVLQHRLISKQPADPASCADEMLALFIRGAGGAK